MSADLESLVTAQLRLTNTGSRPLDVWLEPWGRKYVLEPHKSADVVFEAEASGVPEVLHEDDRIVVYGWPTAIARVFRDGVELIESPQQ
jgi:hypothetical protein